MVAPFIIRNYYSAKYDDEGEAWNSRTMQIRLLLAQNNVLVLQQELVLLFHPRKF